MSIDSMEKLRLAGKNERRCIMRHALGFYRALVVTGLYTQHLEDASSGATSIEAFIPALKWCIATHPILSAAISGEGSEAPEFVRPPSLDLRNHIEIIESGDTTTNGSDLLKQVTMKTHDGLFPDIERIPPWKIVVLPLPLEPGSSKRRLYILFAFSHSHGDGKSGLAFHRTFLQGLEAAHGVQYNQDPIHNTPSLPFLPPIEDACDLRISWSYLLGPFLGAYLPKFMSNALNLHASSTPQTADTWLGKQTSYDPDNFKSGLEIVIIEKKALDHALATCKAHGAKLTGLLHQAIVRVLSEALPADTPAGNFVSQTAIDLRGQIPKFSDDDMTICVTADYEILPRFDGTSDDESGNGMKDNEAMWNAARKTTALLAARASTLTDQPVGLLQYLAHFRMWLMGQLGKERDTSYELSNILSFDPLAYSGTAAPPQQTKKWEIGTMIFSQPANVTSGPLSFQVVSRKGGDMVITLSWQIGVLDVADEGEFVKGIGNRLRDFITTLQ